MMCTDCVGPRLERVQRLGQCSDPGGPCMWCEDAGLFGDVSGFEDGSDLVV